MIHSLSRSAFHTKSLLLIASRRLFGLESHFKTVQGTHCKSILSTETNYSFEHSNTSESVTSLRTVKTFADRFNRHTSATFEITIRPSCVDLVLTVLQCIFESEQHNGRATNGFPSWGADYTVTLA